MAQRYKSIYFSDLPRDRKRSVNIGFSAEDWALADRVTGLPSANLRGAIGVTSFEELRKQAATAGQAINSFCIERLRSWNNAHPSNDDVAFRDPLQATFSGGRGEPLHEWFPYLEGFSSLFVEEVIQRYIPKAQSVLDPFAGLGTTPLTAMRMGMRAYYADVNPLCRFLIGIKRDVLKMSAQQRHGYSARLLVTAASLQKILSKTDESQQLKDSYSIVFGKSVFFDAPQFSSVLRLRTLIDKINESDPVFGSLVTVAAVRALVPGSRLIRRGDLRFKTEAEARLRDRGFCDEVVAAMEMMAHDLLNVPSCDGSAVEVANNAIGIDQKLPECVDAIITSPPYLNGTNYFRNAKLELWFSRELKDQHGLRRLRFEAITAGINDVTAGKTASRAKVFQDKRLQGIVRRLRRDSYDARIGDMVATYFADMWLAMTSCSNRLSKNGVLALDIGDLRYGEIHVPTDVILASALEALGLQKIGDVCLRQRASRGGFPLRETLLIYSKV